MLVAIAFSTDRQTDKNGDLIKHLNKFIFSILFRNKCGGVVASWVPYRGKPQNDDLFRNLEYMCTSKKFDGKK